MSDRSLFEELKRRRVFRATATYVVVASGAIALANDAFPALQLPPWTVSFVVVLAMIGVPVTVALSWAFDIRTSDRPEAAPFARPEEPGAVQRPPAPGPARRWTVGRITVVGAAAVLALTGAAMLVGRGEDTSDLVAHRVAVLPFENHTGDPELDELGVVAADWITDGLTLIETVQVVPTTEVRELLTGAGAADRVTLLVRRSRAGLVVTGSYTQAGDSLQIRAQLVDLREKTGLASFDPVRSHRSDPTAGLGPIRDRVMGAVAVRLGVDYEMTAGTVPPTYRAFRSYLAGLELFLDGQYARAIPYLEQAVQADSTFWTALFRIAFAYGNMGQPAREDSVLRLIEPHRAELSEVGRITLDWGHATLRGDLAAAHQFARRSYQRAPGSVSRYLAGLYALSTNRPREAVDLLGREPRESEFRRKRFNYHVVLTDALHVLGEYDKEFEAAREARTHFPDRPGPIYVEARALAGLRRPAEAEARASDLLLLTLSPTTAANWLERIGDALAAHAHAEASERLYGRALDLLEKQGDTQMLAGKLAYADLFRRVRRLEEAAAHVAAARELDRGDRQAHELAGIIAAQRGDRHAAERIDAELAARGDPYDRGVSTYARACIRAQLGDLDRAIELLRQAHVEGQPIHHWIHLDPDLRPLRGHPVFEALIRPNG
jgi:TolB-like protein/tetratricopeptide (TPR) repeat protein